MLDAAEYLHLAIHANSREDRHSALRYIKDALAIEPDNLRVRYFLASLYIDLGLTQRAQKELQTVLDADPSLDGVRLQIAKLSLQNGNEADARKHFVELCSNSDELIQAYATATVLLIDGKMDEAKMKFGQILSKVEAGSPMSEEVQRILYRMTLASAVQPAAKDTAAVELKKPSLDAYKRA